MNTVRQTTDGFVSGLRAEIFFCPLSLFSCRIFEKNQVRS